MRRTVLPAALLACLFAILLLPFGQAGTPEKPEVADDKDDAKDELDLRSLWFDGNNTTVGVHLEVKKFPTEADTAPCAQGNCQGLAVSYRVFFRSLRPDGEDAPLLPAYEQTALEFRWGWGDAAAAGTIAYVTGEGDVVGAQPIATTISGTRIDFSVPRSHALVAVPDGATPGEYRLNGTFADSRLLRCTPAAGDVAASCDAVSQSSTGAAPSSNLVDRAPDAGLGADFVFAAPPGPPANVTTVTVTATATVTATDTRTSTVSSVSETISVLSYNSTASPRFLERQGLPGPGVGALMVLGLAAVAMRRRL